jgi:RNA polymerase sigma factor (sigma-70 family)
VYDNVRNRIKSWHFEDKEIKDLKTAESSENYELAGRIYKKIITDNNLAISELYKNTEHAVYHYVVNNSGKINDSVEVWYLSFSKLWDILKRKPNPLNKPKFYEWRPISTETHAKAKLSTFFISICYFKWKDELRRRKKVVSEEPESFDGIDISSYDEINDYYDFEDLKFRLRRAIQHLGDTCRKIIQSKYFGGKFGDGVSSKETAQEINRKAETIDNKHPKCLEELRRLMKLQAQ